MSDKKYGECIHGQAMMACLKCRPNNENFRDKSNDIKIKDLLKDPVDKTSDDPCRAAYFERFEKEVHPVLLDDGWTKMRGDAFRSGFMAGRKHQEAEAEHLKDDVSRLKRQITACSRVACGDDPQKVWPGSFIALDDIHRVRLERDDAWKKLEAQEARASGLIECIKAEIKRCGTWHAGRVALEKWEAGE